jgi:hypothetical protein
MIDDPFRTALDRLETPDAERHEPASSPQPHGVDPSAAAGAPEAVPTQSPAQERFRSCRWRAQEGEHCTHRDVLPMAGKDGFNPDAWCPDCGFYKLRRTPKKRDYNNSGY